MDPMGKDPTSSSCEELVLSVALPEVTSADNIDLEVKAQRVTVQTLSRCATASRHAAQIRLSMHLTAGANSAVMQ